MKDEVWREIPGWESYMVSNYGDVVSYMRERPKLLRFSLGRFNHRHVTLFKEGKGKRINISNLVLIGFGFPKPSPTHQAAHWDGNPENNRLDNLRWATPKQNGEDKVRHGTSTAGEKNTKAKLTDEEVVFIRQNYKRISYNRSNAAELMNRFNISRSQLRGIVANRFWRHLR